MPRSKHRRKPGSKAIKSPGRGRTPVLLPEPKPLWLVAFHRYQRPFKDAFREAFPNDARIHHLEYLADCIVDAVFDPVELRLRPASKEAVFADFIEPPAFEDEDLPPPWYREPHTVEMAENGLRLLIERQLVVVEGDQIVVHPRITEAATPEIRVLQQQHITDS